MKRILINLAASAAILSLATGAYALAQLDKSHSSYKNSSVVLAQATGSSTGTNAGKGPSATEPEEQVTGKRKTDADMPPPPANPDATDTTGSIGTTGSPDASQSKRNDTAEPTQSGTK
jgi:hypothetical protein